VAITPVDMVLAIRVAIIRISALQTITAITSKKNNWAAALGL
jgi:hypothetical protein